MALRLLTHEPSELERVTAAAAGDAAAQAWIVQRWTPAVFRFCARLLRDPEDARDVTQDAMLRVIRNLHRYDPERRFSTWVFGIARNAAIDEHRRRRTTPDPTEHEPVDLGPSPLEESTRQQRARRLHEALDSLPELYREVLVLYHFEHLKYQEIAETLDLPIGTVMNRIFRARRKLREVYERQGVGAPPEELSG